jgi:hypothetical protein
VVNGTRNGCITARGVVRKRGVVGCHDSFAFDCLFKRRGKSMGGEKGVQGN